MWAMVRVIDVGLGVTVLGFRGLGPGAQGLHGFGWLGVSSLLWGRWCSSVLFQHCAVVMRRPVQTPVLCW